MKNLIALFLLLVITICCQDGSAATYNEEYTMLDKSKDLPFSKLIGKYKLDKDSKMRYNIPDSLDFYIELGIKNRKDTFLSANRYVNPMDRTIVDNLYYNNKLLYLNDFKTLSPSNNDFLGGGGIIIYTRKKDNRLALYAYTPFVPATEKNGMQYKEGDYLRYIKMD